MQIALSRSCTIRYIPSFARPAPCQTRKILHPKTRAEYRSVATFCAATSLPFLFDCAIEPCRATCANATLELNQLFRTDPVKTSEIFIQIVKERKISKGKSFPFLCGLFRTAAASIRKWWSQTGSNRRPPACKAGALPAELWPLTCHKNPASVCSLPHTCTGRIWWVWEDLNFRPHPYQGCALTN